MDTWRHLPASQWQVTPETARLLQHWRHHEFGGARPFFCQIEAVETAIGFTEVASHLASGKRLMENLKTVNAEANPHIQRLALKLATGAGKTTVMAMLIAWQTLNAVRRPGSKHFTRGFLIVAPGLDDPRSSARPSTERSGQLLRHPRAGPARPARGHEEGAHRHHELPRLQAPRPDGTVVRRTCFAARRDRA